MGSNSHCVMAPTLFSMMLSAVLMDAFQDSDSDFPIRYRVDGNIFNLTLKKKKVIRGHFSNSFLFSKPYSKLHDFLPKDVSFK